MVHLRRRQYSCLDCNKEYLKRTSLTDHYQSHTRERPYSCPTCERTFFRRATLAKHKITHVEIQPVKYTLCDISNGIYIIIFIVVVGLCDKSFLRFCGLNKHLARYHYSESTKHTDLN